MQHLNINGMRKYILTRVLFSSLMYPKNNKLLSQPIFLLDFLFDQSVIQFNQHAPPIKAFSNETIEKIKIN